MSGREDKMGQAWPQRQAASQWPHLWSTAHTCHPLVMCLSVSNTHITYCTRTHSKLKDKCPGKDTQSWMQTLLSELQLEGHAVLCWTLMILALSRRVSPLLYPLPFSSSSTHSAPSPFLLCFLPVRETDVHSEQDRHRRPRHLKLLKISKCTQDAETMRHERVFACYQLFCQPRTLITSFYSRTWSEG